jgi:hypothetical protein
MIIHWNKNSAKILLFKLVKPKLPLTPEYNSQEVKDISGFIDCFVKLLYLKLLYQLQFDLSDKLHIGSSFG